MTQSPENQWLRRVQFASVLTALLLRLAWIFVYAQSIENEGTDYGRLAQNLWSGQYHGILGGPQSLFPPFYPILIALVSLVTRDAELAGRLISAAAGALLVLPVSALVLRIAGVRAAIVAAILVALHPALIGISAAVLSEPLYFTLLLASLAFTVRFCEQPSYRRAVLLGAFVGFAYLTRPEALLIGFGCVAAAGVCLVRRCGWRPVAGWCAAALGVCLLLAAPYVSYLSRSSGYLRLEGKSAFITMMNERMSHGLSYTRASFTVEPGRQPAWPMVPDSFTLPKPTLGQTLRPLATGMATRTREWIQSLLTCKEFGAPLIFLFAAPGLLRIRRVTLAAFLVLLSAAWSSLSLMGIWFVFGRYLYVILVFLVLFAALGIHGLSDWLSSRVAPRFYPALCGVMVALLLVPAVAPALISSDLTDCRRGFTRQVGQWIAAANPSCGKRPRLMTHGSAIPYYAGANLVYLPYTDSDAALQYVAQQRPDYIVLSPDERRRRPYMAAWLEQGIPHPCARLLRRFPVTGQRGDVLVYRWQCPAE